ncbi:probable carboxylesterase 120 [Pistacia vera]|uniref:probable carboxylesterase 120 n=1 Tax=Pistacia vera TaxID=55513 RepID=UPI001263C389|nr:probable carboxylesterase 120 [Pistacia vera]
MSHNSALSATFDPYEYLQIVLNPDGTITRKHSLLSGAAATSDPSHHTIPSKDISINQSNNVGVRIYLPRQALDSSSTVKLPLIVYYHGGGFIIGNVAASVFHNFCSNMALEFPAVVLSVKYRLAPEHRLPAAYDDAMEALHWIRTTQEVWLKEYADLSSCFLMGTSAGGNIVYHVGLRAASQIDELFPLKVKGLILHQPFIGGVKRTESELRLMNNPVFPACVSDLMWDLSLPHGVDRDHEYCNPTVGDESKALDQIRVQEWKVVITGWNGDPMIDRQIELVKMIEQKGVKVKSHFCDGGYHGIDIVDATKMKDLQIILKNFVLS